MMRVQMMVTKVVESPPRGRVVYPRGAFVNVADDTALAWMHEKPKAAKDPTEPVQQKSSEAESWQER